MLHVNKNRTILTIVILMLIITGCANQKSPVDQIYNVLEQVTVKETGFEKQQKPLSALENNEKAIYDQIIKLGMNDYDQIVKLANEAISSANKRQSYMDKETNSIQQSEKEFKKVTVLIKGLDKPALKKQVNLLYDIMMQRYKAHEELYTKYSEAVQNDKQLYEMFKNKNLPLNNLEIQVNKVNEIYKQVSEVNDTFNKLTGQYNAKKLEFYKSAGIDTK